MSEHDRVPTCEPLNTSDHATEPRPGLSTSSQTDITTSENDTHTRAHSGTSASLPQSPPHRRQPTQLLVSFPRSEHHRPRREIATDTGDSDSEADDEGLEYLQRVELSYEGTLWAFEKMIGNGWINAKRYERAREEEESIRPVEPLQDSLRFAPEFRLGGEFTRATLPSTRASTTPQISPRSIQVPAENPSQAALILQPDLGPLTAAALMQLSSTPQISSRSTEAPPENPRQALSVWPPPPSWFFE
ncbi:uncharacterized protein MYCFIDRAFT_215356 [Pseudocercospora fijiensis CIRAD86]|uniref:Uncharacterized protein n=1 Tax=Pseudocercospora fijiensis (strain CIRAD86) TaxID=383855 RepID=M3B2D1_PSEFD|nr:uncharacterized protein MYCFIDRAFT_215356 [Pseudocercospora fijiensis CIRAD86]EME83567.1 hypothetical protein MYCFIDRAFT_215356 [Pseudocercospora fijiensis CIRAD86]